MQKKNRGKRIVITVLVAAVLAATIILLACGGSDAGVNAPEKTEQKQITLGTKQKSDEKDDPAEIPEAETEVGIVAEESVDTEVSAKRAPVHWICWRKVS